MGNLAQWLPVYPTPSAVVGPVTRVVVVGQSNCLGTVVDPTWSGEAVHAGVTIDRNGARLATYPDPCGPLPYLVQELIDAGATAADVYVCVRAADGASVANVIGTHIPAALADVTAEGGGAPDVVWIWHGEVASQDDTEAAQYEHDVVHMARILRHRWPNARIVVQELRHQDATYGASHALVRASQTAAVARIRESVICPSLTPTPLALQDDVHCSPTGYAEAAARAVPLMVT